MSTIMDANVAQMQAELRDLESTQQRRTARRLKLNPYSHTLASYAPEHQSKPPRRAMGCPWCSSAWGRGLTGGLPVHLMHGEVDRGYEPAWP